MLQLDLSGSKIITFPKKQIVDIRPLQLVRVDE